MGKTNVRRTEKEIKKEKNPYLSHRARPSRPNPPPPSVVYLPAHPSCSVECHRARRARRRRCRLHVPLPSLLVAPGDAPQCHAPKLLGGMPSSWLSTPTTLPSPRTPPEPPSRPWRRPRAPRLHSPPLLALQLPPSTSSTKTEPPPSPWIEARVAIDVLELHRVVHRDRHRRLHLHARNRAPI